MSRNSSGTYSLPAGNPVVSATTISSSWANNTMSDIATELTDSLSRSGKGAMLAALESFDGTLGVPGIGFGADPDNGFYRSAANTWHLVVGGALVATFASAAIRVEDGSVSVPSISFDNDPDTGIYAGAVADLRMAIAGADVLKLVAGIAKLTGTSAAWRSEDTNATADEQVFEWLNSAGVFALRCLQDDESTVVATPISITHAGVVTLGTATTVSGALTASAAFTAASTAALQGAVTITGAVTAAKQVSIPDHTDTSSSNAVTFDFVAGNILECTLTEDISTITLSNLIANGVYEIWITQHASAAKTVAGWTGVTWVGGSAPTMNTTVDSLMVVQLRKNGTIILGTALNAG